LQRLVSLPVPSKLTGTATSWHGTPRRQDQLWSVAKRVLIQMADPPSSAISDENPPLRMRTDNSGGSRCRFSNCVADGDVSTSSFAEFSSKWRTVVSHLRGGS